MFRTSILAFIVLASSAACVPQVRLTPTADPRPCAAVVGPTGGAAPEPVTWLRPDHPGDRRALDDWCAGVGPAVVARRPAGPSAAPAGGVVIVTWNAHVGGGDLDGLVRALRRGDLTDGRSVGHFVLLVQEAFRSGPLVPEPPRHRRGVPRRIAPSPPARPRLDMVRAAESLGLDLYYVPSMRNGLGEAPAGREDRGNAILSTLPLAKLQAFELPFERQRRVAIAAVVSGATASGEPWALRVVNVHLDNRAGASRLWLRSAAARARQAAALIEQLPGDGVPIVLGGDLNTWRGGSEPALDIIGRVFPPPRGAVDARPTFAAGLRLDYLFERLPPAWSAAQRRVESRFASDHHPVLAELRIR